MGLALWLCGSVAFVKLYSSHAPRRQGGGDPTPPARRAFSASVLNAIRKICQPRPITMVLFFRREGGNDFVEARIAAEWIPEGVQF